MSRASRRAALLLLLAAGCAGAGEKVDRANALRLGGHPGRALSLYREALADLGEGRLPKEKAEVRLTALQNAADVSYLELGDYQGAVAYYRRLIDLAPGRPEALQARAHIGDIYRDRLGDPLGAIAQWAEIAASDAPQAPLYQLKVAQEYLELKNTEQARIEARILRDKWPRSPEADEAQLLTAQAWAIDRRTDEALRAFDAAIARDPRPDVRARALEGKAQLFAQKGPGERCGRESCLDLAIELYTEALESHPNPEALRKNLEAVRRRRDAARPVRPGDRAAAMDHRPSPAQKEAEPP